jgi:hypothetical protein
MMLLLDRFQTWRDGLVNTPEPRAKAWAFAFTQLLSGIATEHPDKLALVQSPAPEAEAFHARIA